MENNETQTSSPQTMTSESLHWVRVTNMSMTTTEDSFEYFLLSLFPISHCYLERSNNGYLESSGYFAISEENVAAIEGGFLSLNGQTHTLDTVDIKFEIVDAPSTNAPLIKIFHLPKGSLEYDLKQEISKHGTITNFHFTEGYRTARLNLQNPIESKRLVTAELFINGEQIGVKFAGDELGNDDVLLGGDKQSPRVKSGNFDDKKLYLTGFVEDVPYEDLTGYFSRFGKVLDTNLVSIPNRYGPGMIRYGFLHVEDESVGKRIIEQKFHQLGRNRIQAQHSVSKGKNEDERRPQNRAQRRQPQHYQQHDRQQGHGYQDHGYTEQYSAPYQMEYQQGGYPQQQWQPEQPRDFGGYHQQPPHRQHGQYNDYHQGQGYEQQHPQGYEQQGYGQQQGYPQRQYDQWQGQGNDYGHYSQPPQRGYGDRRAHRGGRRR
eukprot:GAHX01000266.1.p1 GENE.GAHX01000266.1~~GAHX01000266.1.p1  ORF type:complete len:447 (+),score=79.46 GAHX01000266.1:46-1341(+)